MTTKYNLYEYSKEFANYPHNSEKKLIDAGCTYACDGDSSPALIKSFNSLAEAKAYMKEHCNARVDRVGSTCWDLFEVYEYYIFRADYDEDGEEIDDENNYDPVAEMELPDDWNDCYTFAEAEITLDNDGFAISDDVTYTPYSTDLGAEREIKGYECEATIGSDKKTVTVKFAYITHDLRDGEDWVTSSDLYLLPLFTADNLTVFEDDKPVDSRNIDYDLLNTVISKTVKDLIKEPHKVD